MTISKEPARIQAMFGSIAGSYDFLNHLLTGWQDVRWRRRAALAAGVGPGGRVLDVCCGTAGLALALQRRMDGQGTVIATDFTQAMLVNARPKLGNSIVRLGRADTLRLPFPDACFDACTVGWGVRNLADLAAGLREMRRVIKPGGRVVVLESTQPQGVLFPHLFRVYFSKVMPLIGNLVSRSKAYNYLQQSVYAFPDAEKLKAIMLGCGYSRVEYHLLTFGTIAIHVGYK